MCLHRLHQCTLTLNAIDLFLDEKILCIGSEKEMTTSDHEEADTRIVLQVHDSLERGSRKIMIRTVDTDVVVILIGHFHSIVDHYPDADLWVAFGTAKHFRYQKSVKLLSSWLRTRLLEQIVQHSFFIC